MDKSLLWLWLSLHFGAGSRLYRDLIRYFDNIENIYSCDDHDMDLIAGISPTDKRKLLNKNLEHAIEVREWCEQNEVQIITYSDVNYPSALKKLRNFPAVLYCKGEMPNFDEELSISVVGTRSMTAYGQKMAFDLGYTLSKGGAITVSGMARGIDSTVAIGTINALGTTVAVLGCGIDIVYPRENRTLMNKIIDYGAVITEYPPHTPPNGYHFPVRNRIISAISNGTVVIEASIDSGAMITARMALEQEKPLFALPGPARMHTSSGTNTLIKTNEAVLVRNAVEILEGFLPEFREKINFTKAKIRPTFSKGALKIASEENNKEDLYEKSKEKKKKIRKSIRKFDEIIEETPEIVLDQAIFSPNQLKLYEVMEKGVTHHIDELVEKTGLSAAEIAASMTMLSIEGAVEEISGGFFAKK
ncbi:MAG: DNA-processing protein DprA [Clostridia bacterium]|nr:DNA-processing protein DprA [Clostridia bacterium]